MHMHSNKNSCNKKHHRKQNPTHEKNIHKARFLRTHVLTASTIFTPRQGSVQITIKRKNLYYVNSRTHKWQRHKANCISKAKPYKRKFIRTSFLSAAFPPAARQLFHETLPNVSQLPRISRNSVTVLQPKLVESSAEFRQGGRRASYSERGTSRG